MVPTPTREWVSGNYIEADEIPVDVQMPEG
jgi:hypothetical protein